MYKIIPHKKVIKFISKRNIKDKHKIKDKFLELAQNPYPNNNKLDIKKLQAKNGFRLRIGDYRFLYDIIEDELIIYMEDANNRGDIY
jgi:mRNA interferase RelE/StbE